MEYSVLRTSGEAHHATVAAREDRSTDDAVGLAQIIPRGESWHLKSGSDHEDHA
jgi:hypothetical protein